MNNVELEKKFPMDKTDLDGLVIKLQRHLDDAFEISLGRFEVEEIISLFSGGVAKHYYNQGVKKAHELIQERHESLQVDLWALEE